MRNHRRCKTFNAKFCSAYWLKIHLQSQLRTILEHGGYLAMGKRYRKKVNPNWSIANKYFMSSLPFLFGQYFAWTRMLQDELNFDLFETQVERDRFLKAIHKGNHSLSSFPPPYICKRKDTQVFSLQQRAMGELLIVRGGEHKQCMSYPEFLKKMKTRIFNNTFALLSFCLTEFIQLKIVAGKGWSQSWLPWENWKGFA